MAALAPVPVVVHPLKFDVIALEARPETCTAVIVPGATQNVVDETVHHCEPVVAGGESESSGSGHAIAVLMAQVSAAVLLLIV